MPPGVHPARIFNENESSHEFLQCTNNVLMNTICAIHLPTPPTPRLAPPQQPGFDPGRMALRQMQTPDLTVSNHPVFKPPVPSDVHAAAHTPGFPRSGKSFHQDGEVDSLALAALVGVDGEGVGAFLERGTQLVG